jgi:hypothetical protein
VVQTGGVALGAFGCLVLCRPAYCGAEVRVLGEFGELHPCLDLIRFGVVRQVGHGRAHHVHEVGVGVQAAEGVVDEVVDEVSALVVGEFRELVNERTLSPFLDDLVSPVRVHGVVQADSRVVCMMLLCTKSFRPTRVSCA